MLLPLERVAVCIYVGTYTGIRKALELFQLVCAPLFANKADLHPKLGSI